MESKSLFGGCVNTSYCDCGPMDGMQWGGQSLSAFIGGGSSSNMFSNTNYILNGGYHSDWNMSGSYYSGGNSGGNSGGGSGGSSDMTDWLDFNGDGVHDNIDPYGLTYLPATVEQQLGSGSIGASVNFAMAFMSSYLGHPITGADMAIRNAQFLNITVQEALNSDLSFDQVVTSMSSYFQLTALSSANEIANAVNNTNHGVFASLYVRDSQGQTIQGLSHSVVIVEYNHSSGLFTCADSTTGSYIYVANSEINYSFGGFEVTGLR
ncbi:hypothetical protein [Flavobacterium sp. CECT 9288]|uniref:hypothetical protein n=1 Tax=Flavobacterium sp. CECT 9288 TaxID=2845819 RepID=UPI001E54F8FD|nr:hypothetical protein [Flavobacterium sp. CECT 9288]